LILKPTRLFEMVHELFYLKTSEFKQRNIKRRK
jgi:hypothetical protein